MQVARRYFVRGSVQGVGFRYFVQKVARDMDLKGWVRNLDDGRVEAYAIGTPAELDEFVAHLWRGPSMADIRGVEQQEAAPEMRSGFHIVP
jgi:acylphosphatase